MTTWAVLVGDVREKLAELPDQSVQCVVTSPPYWGLRDYGHAGQIGLEPTPEAFVAEMVSVFRAVRRVLAGDGVLWLNIGDTYAGGGRGGGTAGCKQQTNIGSLVDDMPLPPGYKRKDLCMVPAKVAEALRVDGWFLRSDVIWSKLNPMPESVTDRPTKAHEYIYMLSKSERYYYDADAIRQRGAQRERFGNSGPKQAANMDRQDGNMSIIEFPNCRSVWSFSTQPYPDAHFATFPEALPERCIKAGSRLGDTVLDPFCGSGTTGQVALQLGRSFIGIELNPKYAELARARIGNAAPLFTTEASA